MFEGDMNPNEGETKPDGFISPENTVQSEETDTNQPRPDEAPRDSIFQETRIDGSSGFTPATAGASSIENSYPLARVRNAINNARGGESPDNTLMVTRSTGGTQKSRRGSGIKAEGGTPPGRRLIGRREFLISAVAAGAVIGSESKTGLIRKGISGALNFFRGGNDDKKILDFNVADEENALTPLPTRDQVPTAIPETTPTQISAPEVEPSIHEEKVKDAAKKYFKEIGEPINNFGEKLFITSSVDIQSRIPSSPNAQGFVENAPIHEVYADLSEFPDGIARIQKAVDIGLYLAWNEMQDNKKDSQIDLALNEIPDLSKLQGLAREEAEREISDKSSEFTKRVNSGEDFSFNVRGYNGIPSTFTTEIKVNPNEPVVVVFLPDKNGSYISETAKRGVSFTEIDGILFIGLHGMNAGAGYEGVSKQKQWHFRSEASGDLSVGVGILGIRSIHEQLEKQDILTSVPTIQLQQRVDIINSQMVSNFLDKNNYMSWTGPLRVK